MGSIGVFFAMGGHGVYVWSSYAIAVVVIGTLIVASRRALKAREAEVAALEAAIATQPSPAMPVGAVRTIADTGSTADEFSLRGLLVGCAVGSAAAAMILLVIRTFFIA